MNASEIPKSISTNRTLERITRNEKGEEATMRTYQNDGISSGKGEDIGARNNARANPFKLVLDQIDLIETLQGQIGDGPLLSGIALVACSGIQQDGSVATLREGKQSGSAGERKERRGRFKKRIKNLNEAVVEEESEERSGDIGVV